MGGLLGATTMSSVIVISTTRPKSGTYRLPRGASRGAGPPHKKYCLSPPKGCPRSCEGSEGGSTGVAVACAGGVLLHSAPETLSEAEVHRRCNWAYHQHRRADQSACAQRYHRGGPSRRRKAHS